MKYTKQGKFFKFQVYKVETDFIENDKKVSVFVLGEKELQEILNSKLNFPEFKKHFNLICQK